MACALSVCCNGACSDRAAPDLDETPMQCEIRMQIWMEVPKIVVPTGTHIRIRLCSLLFSADGVMCCMQANGEQVQEPRADVRDAEIEEEITGAVRRDPLAAYDVDVALEGAAIEQYLALLQQQQQASGGA